MVERLAKLREHNQLQISPPILALILAVLLFFFGGILNPDFVNLDQAINIVRLAAFLGIVAAGQTIVIISGGEGIDLSIGAVVTLGAILTFRITDGEDSRVLIGLAALLAAGTSIGLINGLGIVLLRIPPLVMTLGMTGVIQGTILVITQGEMVGDTPEIMSDLIARPLIGKLPGVTILWIIVGVGMWVLLERTRLGKNLFAIGTNRTTARLSGVRVPYVVIAAFTLSGLLSAFGGFVLLAFAQTVFLQLGDSYLFPSIAAVVVGGTVLAGGRGSYWGTMAGALVLTVIDSLLRAQQLEEAYQLMVLGLVLVALTSVYGREQKLRQ
ncbi:MAG: ABC transporter permease [Anaerolineae bacterium]|nr:ABC transporter permease [Anaerolineae bacterium]